MKKIKWIFCVLILCFFALIIIENKAFFLPLQFFTIDVWVARYQTPSLPIWAHFLITFALGAIAMFLLSVPGWFKSKKTVKSLNETVTNQRRELDDLKNEIGALVRGPETMDSDSVPADMPSAEDTVTTEPVSEPESKTTTDAEVPRSAD